MIEKMSTTSYSKKQSEYEENKKEEKVELEKGIGIRYR